MTQEEIYHFFQTGQITLAEYLKYQELPSETIKRIGEAMEKHKKDKLHKAADEYAKRFSPWLYSCIMEAFIDGAEWQKKQTIDKACEWLNNFYNEDRHCFLVKEDIEAFEKSMMEE